MFTDFENECVALTAPNHTNPCKLAGKYTMPTAQPGTSCRGAIGRAVGRPTHCLSPVTSELLRVCHVAHPALLDLGEHSLKPFAVEPMLKFKVFHEMKRPCRWS